MTEFTDFFLAWKKSVTKSLSSIKLNQSVILEMLESLVYNRESRNIVNENGSHNISLFDNFPLDKFEDVTAVEERLEDKTFYDSLVCIILIEFLSKFFYA